MQRALAEAESAGARGEVPVGAVLVSADGEVLGEGWNRNIVEHDPTAHAEVVAMRQAGKRLGNHRLLGATLYVTLEPCAMCAGVIVLSRLPRVVFSAYDPKAGMCGSLENLVQDPRLNHRVSLSTGVLERECGDLLRDFFRRRRGLAAERRDALE